MDKHKFAIERVRNKALARELENAQKEGRTDDITSAAANKKASDERIQKILKEEK